MSNLLDKVLHRDHGRLEFFPQGIDVTESNGEFDWPAWKGHIDFAMAMATRGADYADVQFGRNWQEIRSLGVHRFACHEFNPVHDPGKQAEWFLTIAGAGDIEPGDNFAFYWDSWEDGSPGIPPVEASFAAWVFTQEFQRLSYNNYHLLCYTYPSFAEAGYCAKLGQSPLWVANFDTPVPHVPAPWRNWVFWQDNGQNLGRDVFNGTLAELDTFCQGS